MNFISRIKTKNYIWNNVQNADEFGFFYQMPPTQTIEPTPIPGRKKEEEKKYMLSMR